MKRGSLYTRNYNVRFQQYLALLVLSELVRMFQPFITGMAHAATGWNINTLLLNLSSKRPSSTLGV